MLSLNLFIICSFVIATQVSWSNANKDRSAEEYLPYWSYPSNEQVRVVEWIENALRKQAAKSPDETQSTLEKLASDVGFAPDGLDQRQTGVLRKTLVDLIKVVNLEDASFCSTIGVESFLANVLAVRGATGQRVSLYNPKSTQGKSAMFDYLMANGPKHSQRCLGHLSNSFEEKILNSRDLLECESKLDQVISLGKAAGQPEEKLLQLAGETDFETGRFDGKRMQQVVERVFGLKSAEAQETLFRFLDDTCYQYRLHVSDIFDSFNLARIILPSAMRYTQFGAKFYKFNEYSRLCAQIQAPHLRDSIRAQFSKSRKWY